MVKNSSQLRILGPSWYLLLYRCNACWKPAKSKREIYVTNIEGMDRGAGVRGWRVRNRGWRVRNRGWRGREAGVEGAGSGDRGGGEPGKIGAGN